MLFRSGWLKAHRTAWYKHHLDLNYSSRVSTFSAPASSPREARKRLLSGLGGPSSSALLKHSFPQPEDLTADEDEDDDGDGGERNGDAPRNGGSSAAGPVGGALLHVPRSSDRKEDVVTDEEWDAYADAPSEPDNEPGRDTENIKPKPAEASTPSFTTAFSRAPELDGAHQNRAQEEASGLHIRTAPGTAQPKALGKRPVSIVESSSGVTAGSTVGVPSVDAASTSSLLPDTDANKVRPDAASQQPSMGLRERAKKRSQNQSSDIGGTGLDLVRSKTSLRNLVKFDIPEDSKRAELHLKAKAAQVTIQRASTKLRRQKLKDGLVVKMERMLVRVDKAGTEVPDEFDENASQKIDSRVKDKWREYMVVCRQSISDECDFVLQMYKTRVFLHRLSSVLR